MAKIEPHARLIASLAETMSDNMWASDVLTRCRQIEEAVAEIRKVARSREGGER
jgi:hypothetical protein